MKLLIESANALANWNGPLESIAWKSLTILACVLAAMIFCRRHAAAARHLAWTMTFLCLLALPVFVKCFPVWHPPVWITASSFNNNLPNSLKFVLGNFTRQKSEAPEAVSKKQISASSAQKFSPQTASVQSPIVKGNEITVAIWFAGVMIVLARILAAQIQLRRMTRGMWLCENPSQLEILENLRRDYQIKRPVKLLISEISASPMTWGIWRPVIALPAESCEWPDGRLRVVLRHELAHVRRWDCLTQELAQLVCAFYWFNPLAWLAARRMRAEREKACDDFVLNGGTRPAEYANHLVEIARQFSAAHLGGAVAMARPSGLESRVVAILDDRCNRNAIGKITAVSITLAIFGLGILIGGCSTVGSQKSWSLKHSAVSAQLKSFVAEKEAQESKLIRADEKDLAKEYAPEGYQFVRPDCQPFFAAAAKGDWQTVSNLLSEMEKHTFGWGLKKATNGYPRGMWLSPVRETYGAIEAFAVGNEKYSAEYAKDIIDSIPPGSIYFGGTDPGRFIITALQKSHVDGDPFFTLTQNALADNSYLDYLQSMYGDKIYIPTKEDSQKCFRDYMEDATRRFQNHQLRPGESVKVDRESGRVEVSGQVAVMQINGLLAKIIFDQNTNREFYIEESFPLDWMYPYLEPHGLIFKINRQPLPELSDEIVQRDHDYWTKMIQPMIGDWLNDDTPVSEIAAFAEKVFAKHDFIGFSGDPQFVQNDYSCKMFSKERNSIGGLYNWRARHATSDVEKKRMQDAADSAFRQAWALCPYSPEIVTGYVALLMSENRRADALLVAETAAKMPEMKGRDGDILRQLATVLANPDTKFK